MGNEHNFPMADFWSFKTCCQKCSLIWIVPLVNLRYNFKRCHIRPPRTTSVKYCRFLNQATNRIICPTLPVAFLYRAGDMALTHFPEVDDIVPLRLTRLISFHLPFLPSLRAPPCKTIQILLEVAFNHSMQRSENSSINFLRSLLA